MNEQFTGMICQVCDAPETVEDLMACDAFIDTGPGGVYCNICIDDAVDADID